MDDADDLIERLLAVAGSILEDASAMALLKGATRQSDRMEAVRQTAREVGAIVEACDVVLRRL